MANKLAKALAAGLGNQALIGFGPMTLIRVAPGTRSSPLTAAAEPSETSYPCKGRQGVKSSGYSLLAIPAIGNQARTSLIGFTILGATLPDGITPRAGDLIVHSSVTYTIASDGSSNPDGVGAVWECMTRKGGG